MVTPEKVGPKGFIPISDAPIRLCGLSNPFTAFKGRAFAAKN